MNLARPLLLLDVDGVISLFGFNPASPPAGRFELVEGIAHFLSATAGDHLRELSRDFELAWCSGWEEKADQYLPVALGIPSALPYLTFEREIGGRATAPGRANRHWKLDAI